MAKRIFMLLAPMVFLVLLTACGNQAAEPTQGAAQNLEQAGGQPGDALTRTPVVVVGAANALEWMQQAIDRFEVAFPQYYVDFQEQPGDTDMYARLVMMMQSPATSPDIIMQDGFMIITDSSAGLLQPLDDLFADWDELDLFFPALLDGARGMDGRLYGIPWSTDTQGIYYNKYLFEQVGLTVPWQPRNWDDILDAAIRLRDAFGDDPDFIPIWFSGSRIVGEATSMRTFQILLSGTGGTLYDRDEHKWVVDRENLLRVFEFINTVMNVERVGPEPAFLSQGGAGTLIVSELKPNNQVGMAWNGSWIMSNFAPTGSFPWAEADDVLGYVHWPTSDGQYPYFTSMSGGWTWAIPTHANNTDGAVEFMKFLADYDTLRLNAMIAGHIGVRMDMADDEEFMSQPFSTIRTATEQLNFTNTRPSFEGYPALSVMFTEVVESVVIGQATPEQALENFQREMLRLAGEESVIIR